MTEIREQLKDFCDCIPEVDDDVFDKNVFEVINLISIMTCWAQSPCETFLNSKRTEYMDVERFDPCACDGGIVEFEPYYIPVQPDSFEVSLVERSGINKSVIPIGAADFAFEADDGVLRVDLRDYISFGNCGCTSTYRLKIVYSAGYELIPECLLQLFCDLLHVVIDKNNCSCPACQACKDDEDKTVSFDDEVSPSLDKYLNALIESGYKKQLGLISLCGRKHTDLWGVVV